MRQPGRPGALGSGGPGPSGVEAQAGGSPEGGSSGAIPTRDACPGAQKPQSCFVLLAVCPHRAELCVALAHFLFKAMGLLSSSLCRGRTGTLRSEDIALGHTASWGKGSRWPWLAPPTPTSQTLPAEFQGEEPFQPQPAHRPDFLETAQKAGDAQPVHSCLSSLGQRQHGAVADEGALEAGSPGLDRGVACVVPPT